MPLLSCAISLLTDLRMFPVFGYYKQCCSEHLSFFLAALSGGLWDLSSPDRDRTQTLGSESAES